MMRRAPTPPQNQTEAASSLSAAPSLCPESRQLREWEGDRAGEKGVSGGQGAPFSDR